MGWAGRVALVSEHASPLAVLGDVDAGGQNVHVAALAEHLAARGHRVSVYTRRDDRALPAVVELGSGIDVVHIDAGPPTTVPKDQLLPFMGDFAEQLRRAWRRHRPDIVHAHFWMSGTASLTAGRDVGIPVLQTFHALGIVKRRHQGDKDTSPPGRIAVEAKLVRDVDHVIATCSDELFELIRLGGDRARISIVPCGVDIDRFCPEGPAEPRTASHRVVVVSRLVERKGIGNMIEALASVADTELVIAGGTDSVGLQHDREARRLAELAHRHGVADRVELRGQVGRDAVPALLRSADVVACTPWYEPFGIVPLEAMACGRPVLATAVGGLTDTVVDGVTGVHVPPRRPDRIAGALTELLGDPSRRAAMGRAGRERVQARYGWARVAAATAATYERVLARSAATTEAVGRHQREMTT